MKRKELTKNKKGITLIALIVSIIVLLILAGVSVTTVFNSEGLFYKASESANKHKIAQIQEELELLKTLVMPGTLEDYMTRLKAEREKYRASEFEKIDDEHYTVVIEERYEFLIYSNNEIEKTAKVSSRSGNNPKGNIIIQFEGEVNTGLLELSSKKGDIYYPTVGEVRVKKNTSGGELRVISADESIATASIEGNVVTITPKLTNEAKKIVTITVMSEPKGEYLRQKAKYRATIYKGSITIEAKGYEGEFDGKKHPAVTIESVDPVDAKLLYSLEGEGYINEIPEVEMTGEYTVSIKAEREGYDSTEITKTVTINKQSNKEGSSNPNLVLSETSGIITYPTTKSITVQKNTSEGSLSVSSSNESIATATISGNTITITPQAILEDGQKVTITVKAQETDNYEEQTAKYEATVRQGSITITAEAFTGEYNEGSHQAISNISTNPPGCTLEYSLNGGSYSTNIPTVIGQGTYTVTIKATKPGYMTKEENKTVTINAGTITIYATARNVEYTGSSYTAAYGVSTNPTGCTITYTLNGSNYGTSVPYISGQGTYTLIITATKAGYKTQTRTLYPRINAPALPSTQPSGGWTIEEVKKVLVRDGLRLRLGDEVKYSPSAGGTWRIYYYDTEGYFGTRNTIYIKRDQNVNGQYRMVEPSSYPSAAVALMKRMNPKWRDSSYSTIDTSAEKSLTDNYNVETGTQFVTYPASYAGACPSLEMFAKSYNVWKTGNPNGGIITPYIKNQYGYGLSALPTNIEYGPKNLYILSNALACWMASPSPASDAPYGASVFVLYGDTRTLGWKNVGGRNISYEPVVSIGTT